jgi:hypothetical protein
VLGVHHRARIHDPAFVVVRFFATEHVQEIGPVGKILTRRDVLPALLEALPGRQHAGQLHDLMQGVASVAGGRMLDPALHVAA